MLRSKIGDCLPSKANGNTITGTPGTLLNNATTGVLRSTSTNLFPIQTANAGLIDSAAGSLRMQTAKRQLPPAPIFGFRTMS